MRASDEKSTIPQESSARHEKGCFDVILTAVTFLMTIVVGLHKGRVNLKCCICKGWIIKLTSLITQLFVQMLVQVNGNKSSHKITHYQLLFCMESTGGLKVQMDNSVVFPSHEVISLHITYHIDPFVNRMSMSNKVILNAGHLLL